MVWLQAALVATAISGTGETVLLDFYADWCGPCRAMDPTINALVEQGLPVRKVNIDRDPQLARKHGVGSIPCYVMLVEGREVDRVVGGTSFSRLKRMCQLALDQRPRKQSSSVLAQVTGGPTRPPLAIPAVQGAPPLETAAHQPAQGPDGPPSAPGWTPRRDAQAVLDGALIAASVRLRIEDADGHSCGSGTIIDARPFGGASPMSHRWWGEALILTCGHIFRDSQGKGRIEVDLFGPNGEQRVEGTLISYDCEKRDVGLVSIRTPGPVTTARVAPPECQIGPGERVVSVGCNNGDRPTTRHSRVTSLNKFMGPPNLQVAGLPVEGRSGGGLFSEDGMVIGVCNAADPSDHEGLYAALASIHTELDRVGLAYLYKSLGQGAIIEPADAGPPEGLAAADPPSLPRQMPATSEPAPLAALPAQPAAALVGEATSLSVEEQAALDEIRRRLREGAEVICVVRSRRDPAAKSEVIILDKVSPDFLGQLAAESRPQDPLRATSLEIPRKRQTEGGPASPGRPKTPLSSAPARGRAPAGHAGNGTGSWRSSPLQPGARR